MVQILQRPKSSGEQFQEAFAGVGDQALQTAKSIGSIYEGKKENEAIERLIGKDLSGLSPDMKKEYLKHHMAAQNKPQNTKELDKQKSIQMGLGTIKEMRKYLSNAGPTNYVASLMGGETTKNRSKLRQLGTSLIPLVAAGVPIRNQSEFEEYRKVITNPNSRQSELEGALEGIESILRRQSSDEISPFEDPGETEEIIQQPGGKRGMVKVLAPGGKVPRFVPKDQVNAAIQAGGKVVR